jgi:hypothetical protein
LRDAADNGTAIVRIGKVEQVDRIAAGDPIVRPCEGLLRSEPGCGAICSTAWA